MIVSIQRDEQCIHEGFAFFIFNSDLIVVQILCAIHLVSLTSVNPGLWLVNLAVLVYLPLTQRGSPPLKVNVKYFNLLQLFKFLVKSCETFRLLRLHCCALNLKAKIVTSLLKNWTLNICSEQIQRGCSDALPFYSAGSWVSDQANVHCNINFCIFVLQLFCNHHPDNTCKIIAILVYSNDNYYVNLEFLKIKFIISQNFLTTQLNNTLNKHFA